MASPIVPLLLLLVVEFTPVTAQIVRGRVTDVETGRGLPGTALALTNEQGVDVAAATSDAAGAFELRAPRAGSYMLRVNLLGYVPFTSQPLDVRSRETVQVAIRLSVRPIPMEPLVVTARQRGRAHLEEFENRRTRSGTGHFITRDQIETRVLSAASALVAGAPGVTVRTAGQILLPTHQLNASEQWCAANLYIDGVLFRGNVDEVLIPDWVEGVEIYPRASMAPPQYQLNECGSVLFWTRERNTGTSWSWKKFAVAGAFLIGALLLAR